MVKVVIEFLNPEANRKAKMMRRELIKAIDEAIEKGKKMIAETK